MAAGRKRPPGRGWPRRTRDSGSRSSVDSFRKKTRGGRVPPLAIVTKTGALVLRRDLVERRVGDLVGLDSWRAIDDLREALQHGGIGVAAVGLGVLLLLPQAEGQRFLSVPRGERDLLLEAGL